MASGFEVLNTSEHWKTIVKNWLRKRLSSQFVPSTSVHNNCLRILNRLVSFCLLRLLMFRRFTDLEFHFGRQKHVQTVKTCEGRALSYSFIQPLCLQAVSDNSDDLSRFPRDSRWVLGLGSGNAVFPHQMLPLNENCFKSLLGLSRRTAKSTIAIAFHFDMQCQQLYRSPRLQRNRSSKTPWFEA